MKHDPKIGIFWIVDEKLIAKKVELSKIKEVNGLKDSEVSHFLEWEKMGFDIDEYDKFPRGKIVYKVSNERFLIYVTEEIIQDKKYREMILDYFQIYKNYSFIDDEDYLLKDGKVLNYDFPLSYKFENFIFKLPKDRNELYKYAIYLHCVTGGDFSKLIEKHNEEHLIFGVYFDENNYLATQLKHKNNFGFVLSVSLKDDNIALEMIIEEKQSNNIDYECLIESIYDDEIKAKESIFKKFAKEFKNLDKLIKDAIILMQKKRYETSISYLQRKLQIGYNHAEKIKNQVCMFRLLDEKELL